MTLYNILPPIAFFASLGGIILVVSRVLVRMRHQYSREFTKINTPSDVRKDLTVPPRSGDDATSFLKPNKIGVQVMKSRLGALQHAWQRSSSAFGTWRHLPRRTLQSLMIKKRTSKISEGQTKPVDQKKKLASYVQAKKSNLLTRLVPVSAMVGSMSRVLKTRTATAGKKIIGFATRMPRLKNRAWSIAKPIQVSQPQNALPKTPQAKLHLRTQPASAYVNEVKPEFKKTKISPELPARKKKVDKQEKNAYTLVFEEAQAALQTAHYQHVEEILVPFLAKNPRHIEAYVLLGRAALKRNAWGEALEIFEQVVRLDPDYPGIYKLLGFTALKSSKLTRAFEALKRAHETEPQNKEILEQLLTIAHKTDNRALLHSFTAELAELQTENFLPVDENSMKKRTPVS